MSQKTVVFTGGGSGGHVMPALTLISLLKEKNFRIHYIGGRDGIERELANKEGLSFSPIFTGKLRRYFSIQNFIDIFKVGLGFLQSLLILLRFKRKSTIVFSTGGFVSVPIVFAAKILGFKIFIHEQTTRVGLANKLCSKVAHKVFVSFEESLDYFPAGKSFYSGYPLRGECYEEASKDIIIEGRNIKEINKPILFVTGGGNGSLLINDLIRNHFDELNSNYMIIHQVGKKFIDEYKKLESDNYLPLSFIHKEMIDLYKVADIVISRAGAGTVSELLAIKKKSIFIPLKIAQKNEQYHNAMAASSKLGSLVIEEDNLRDDSLMSLIKRLKENTKDTENFRMPNGGEFLISQIENSF